MEVGKLCWEGELQMLDLTSERSLVAKSRRRLRSMVLATAGHVSRRTVSMPLASNPGVTCIQRCLPVSTAL